ncbi:MAG TPA: hypothetical protein VII73_10645 [Caulobacteraceae bacterium]
MPLALVAAVVAGAATVGGALISSHAVNSASNAATSAAAANNALQTQIYNTNKGLAQPYIAAGDNAETTMDAFLGLGGDAAASKAALDQYLGSTGYQFQLQNGEDAITGNRAASGLLDSGGTLKALDTFGQNLASTSAGSWLSDLSGISNTGESAVNALSGTGATYAGAVGANNTSAATAQGNAAIAGANSVNALIGQGLSAYGLARGQSSYGAGAGPSGGGITLTTGGLPTDA